METQTVDKLQIAIVCHEANRAYCATLGDNSQPDWSTAPEWQKSSAMNGVQFHLNALAAGQEPSPAAGHESWLKQKREEGWTYGLVKDAEKKTHPCFMPYDGLPLNQRLKDYIFSGIVKSFYAAANTPAQAA